MSRNSTITIPMIPFQQAPTAKRKADDANPLLAAAKRRKKDKSGSSSKRKLLNAEETPTGLLIVRAPQDSSFSSSQPVASSSSHTTPPLRPSSSQPSSNPSSSNPPPKKFRASSQPLASNSSRYTQPHPPPSPIPEDPELETAVRAMNDETAHLRRQSRAPTLMDQNTNPAFQFTRGGESSTVATKGKSKEVITDTSLRIPQNETPQIERNKRLREGAMAAISADREDDERVGRGQERRTDQRRRSSVSRGKRVSSTFAATGIITSPHNSVSETSFYKHIDLDLPNAERLRQLLIWCSIRASGSTTFSSSSTPSKSKSIASLSKEPLPPLSDKAAAVLRTVQDDLVRMLAERKIDLSLYGPDAEEPVTNGELKENEQNSKNKEFEVKYSREIRQLEEEEDQWKKVAYHYESYGKRFGVGMEKRITSTRSLSEKAKGKQRQVNDHEDLDLLLPDSQDLPPSLRPSLSLIKSLYSSSSSSSSQQQQQIEEPITILTTSTGHKLTTNQLQTTITNLLPSLSYKLDFIHSRISAIKKTTRIAEQMLNERFKLLKGNLERRRRVDKAGVSFADRKHGLEVVRNYVIDECAGGVSSVLDMRSGGGGDKGKGKGKGIMEIMRALSRIDTARPQSQIGDQVRKAAREVRRIGENGGGGVIGRRLTAVHLPMGGGSMISTSSSNSGSGTGVSGGLVSGVGLTIPSGSGSGSASGSGSGSGGLMTPRKMPSTPRRHGHGTPGRERTPGR